MARPFAPVPVHTRELVKELELGGLRFTESWHAAGSTIARHAHRKATVTMLVDGSFEESYRHHRSMVCDAPAVHIRPPGEPHIDRLGAIGAHNLVIEVEDARLAAIREQSAVFDELRHLQAPAIVQLAKTIQRELMMADQASSLTLEGLALQLFGLASRDAALRHRQPPAWLERVREALHDQIHRHDLRIADLAAVADVHPVHLARAFRACFDTSPGQYLRRLRVDWAAEQIASSDRSLAEIATAAGFADQSHLSRVFKAQMGCTPGAWRRRNRSV